MSKIYEAMFLLDSGYASAHWDQAVKDIQDMLTRHQCEVIRMVKWDDRKLAYEIQHHKRGTYVLIYFTAPGLSVGRIERDVQLSETMLRVLILKNERMSVEDALRMPVPSREKNIIGEELPPIEVPAEETAETEEGAQPVAAAKSDEDDAGEDEGDEEDAGDEEE